MIKLKEVINQLDTNTFREIESELVRSKAKNFHTLLTGLRDNLKTEKEICQELQISNSAFYALKSRLMDKIQERLSTISNFEREELMRILAKIPELCTNTPREMANAILLKLENDLIQQGMHNELLHVYSALKKINLYTPKYFTYSQLFNKSVAYSLSLEKAEEIGTEFARMLSSYLLARSASFIDPLTFLCNEIRNVYELNSSRQIAIIRHVITVQHYLYCNHSNNEKDDIEGVLRECHSLAASIPDKPISASFSLIADLLSFEYFLAAGKFKTAGEHYEKIIPHQQYLFLLNHKCATLSFLRSKLVFCLQTKRTAELQADMNDIFFDPEDQNTKVMLDYYQAMVTHLNGNTKKSISLLNQMINQYSLPNMLHMEVEVKLTLAWFLFLQKDYDMADGTLKKLMRKIKSDYSDTYQHVEYFSKFLDMEINKEDNEKNHQRKKELLVLFMAYNNGPYAIMGTLLPELKEKYQI